MLGSPMIVAKSLIVGGIAILVIERFAPQGHEKGVADISLGKAVGVGFIQCLSMIPGVSRSGATILGGSRSGRRAADRGRVQLLPGHSDHARRLDPRAVQASRRSRRGRPRRTSRIGFVVSFVVAVVVIRWFIGIVSRHGFAPFAWYRIVVGGAALTWLLAS